MSERELCIYYTTQTYVFSDRVCVGNTEVAETLRIVRSRLQSRNDSLILQDERHSDSGTAIKTRFATSLESFFQSTVNIVLLLIRN